jgi:two-component system chemotaxis response regulator CheB
MRKIISDLIAEDPELEVVGTAKNGKEAVEQVKLLRPHAVTMDIEMPEMNGLDALKRIMGEHPTPVIMLSSLTQDGAKETIRALELGAFDFICKPSGSISLDLYKVKQLLHEKLKAAVKANVLMRRAASAVQHEVRPESPPSRQEPIVRTAGPSSKFEHLVAIGTSTGGPRALHQVLSQLPAGFPAPIVIVQHMPPNFTKSLAQRLDDVSQIRVVEAEDGQTLVTGTAYIAPGGWHMTVTRDNANNTYKVRLTKDDPRSGHRPSVDVMYESLVPLKELKRHAVIMTGMGNDGAKGMLALKLSGAVTTIAESEATCVVYGMPRAAVELKGATTVLPQQEIPRKLTQAVLG